MVLNLTTIQTMALAVIVLYLGKTINNTFKFLKENCIPDAVTGGTLFSILTLIGHETGILSFVFEDTLRDVFMIAFFTTVGFSASIKLLKKAGLPVLMFLIAAVALAVLQNVFGVAMAKFLHINLLIGLATGSLATTGGPGTAGAFGPIIETVGAGQAEGATMVAMATATYALIAGSIIAGPICKRLINKHNLLNKKNENDLFESTGGKVEMLSAKRILPSGFQVVIAMGVGSLISNFLSSFMFLIAAVALAVLQNVFGVAMAKFLHINLLIGLATGSLATTGGPGTAGAFGPIIEAVGAGQAEGATMVAMATATYALIAGSIIAGPICKRLINKHNLLNKKNENDLFESAGGKVEMLSAKRILPSGFQVVIAMGVGSLISNFLSSLGMVLPPYIGAMFAASIMRNLSDYSGKFEIDLDIISVIGSEIDLDIISVIGSFTLAMFLSMTLMSFRLWELKELALPLILMLLGQTVLMGVFAYFVTFNLTGRDYDAAVMTGGHCGCGFGTTPKALANMEALTDKYLPSPKAFFVIPIVGGLFIDFFNAAIITFFINLVK